MKKRLTSLLLVMLVLTSLFSCSTAQPVSEKASATASDSGPEGAALWLASRLEADCGYPFTAEGATVTSANAKIVLAVADAAEKYGVDLTSLSDEGFTVRRAADSRETFIFARTNDGLDRGVRYFANYLPLEGEVSYTYGEGAPIKALTISGYSVSEYSVVLPADADECMKYAAEELQKNLLAATGVLCPITTDGTATPAFTLVKDEAYGDEGFNIRTTEDGVTVTGGIYRGCLYGVYSFLEEFLGFVFYYPYAPDISDYDGAECFIRETERLILEAGEIDHTETPSIPSRCLYPWDSLSASLKYNGPMYAFKYSDNAVTEPRFGLYGLFGNATHGLKEFIPESELGQYDPNYVPGRNPCFTSEELICELIDRVIASLDAKVAADEDLLARHNMLVDVAQLDSSSFCMCESCLQVYSDNGAVSGAAIHYANRVAEALEDKYPQVFVGAFAYYGTTTPPTNIKPHKNVTVSYCFYLDDDGGSFCANHPISGEHESCYNYEKFARNYDAWCDICEHMYVWYYPNQWYFMGNTAANLFNVYYDMKYLAERGTYGVMALLDAHETDYGYLKNYMFQRMTWNADITREEFDEILKEVLYVVYGDGYESVYDYLLIMESIGNSAGGSSGCWTGFITAPMIRMDFTSLKQYRKLIPALYENARRYARTAEEEAMVDSLFYFSRYHIAIATHTDMWLNGTEEERREYKANLDAFIASADGVVSNRALYQDHVTVYPPTTVTNYDQNPIEWMIPPGEKPLGGWDYDYNF